ncbi:MAG: hypothetical protein GC188_09585 [Alphaproteobacteria bacterium]|nr:hypothetical protein [Alphaproteobacteria bacterium]
MRDPDLPALKARAEQMRRAGVPVHEVARAVGRAPSTIYDWAAQGGWRVEDLEAEGVGCPPPCTGEVAAKPAEGADAHAPLGPSDHSPRKQGETDIQPDLTPLEAAKQLHQRSADLAAAGQIRPAEAAARLADRILRTEYLLGRVGGAAAPEPPEADAEDIRAELAERFRRVTQHYHERRAAGDPDPGGGVPLGFHRIAEANGCSLDEVMGWPPEM